MKPIENTYHYIFEIGSYIIDKKGNSPQNKILNYARFADALFETFFDPMLHSPTGR